MQHRDFFAWPAWLAVLLLLYTSAVHATLWTVTSYVQVSFETHTFDLASYTYTYTSSRAVRSGVTPTAKPVSTSTSVNVYRQITIIYLYLPLGSVPESDIVTTTTYKTGSNPSTVYVESIVYTAPASCPKAFTVATVTKFDIPSEVVGRLTPTAFSTSIGIYYGYTYVTAYLSPGAVPTDLGPRTSDFIYSYYIASCRNPTANGADYYGPNYTPSYSGGSSSDFAVCSNLTGCTTLRIWVIVIASILPCLFVLGFVESYLWFRRLMLGRSAMRVGTICWILISLWVLCFTATAPARAPEDHGALKMQWDAMSAGTRWKLWWRWGFRNAYPIELLGPDPRKGVPAAQMNPQMRHHEENAPTGYDDAPPPYAPPDSSASKTVQEQTFRVLD